MVESRTRAAGPKDSNPVRPGRSWSPLPRGRPWISRAPTARGWPVGATFGSRRHAGTRFPEEPGPARHAGAVGGVERLPLGAGRAAGGAFMPACSGVRSALRALHASTRRRSSSSSTPPPGERGTTWSIVIASQPGWSPQYWQVWWSRLATFRRLKVTAWPGSRSKRVRPTTSGTRSRARAAGCTARRAERRERGPVVPVVEPVLLRLHHPRRRRSRASSGARTTVATPTGCQRRFRTSVGRSRTSPSSPSPPLNGEGIRRESNRLPPARIARASLTPRTQRKGRESNPQGWPWPLARVPGGSRRPHRVALPFSVAIGSMPRPGLEPGTPR